MIRCRLFLCLLILANLNCRIGTAADNPSADRLLNGAIGTWASGDTAGAREQFTAIIERGTEDARVFYYRGILDEQAGEDGTADFEMAAKFEVERSTTTLVNRSLEKTQGALRGKIEKIRKAARNAIKPDPHAARLKLIYREALEARSQGDLPTAIEKLAEASEMGSDPRYFYMHGVVLAETGDLENAKEAFAEGLRHERTPKDSHLVSIALADVQGEIRRIIEEQTIVEVGDQLVTRQSNARDIQRRALMTQDQLLAEAGEAGEAAAEQQRQEAEARRLAAAEAIMAENKAKEELVAKIAEKPRVSPEPVEKASPVKSAITKGPIDMSWLPPSTEYLTYVRPADLLGSAFVRPLTDMPEFQQALEEMSAEAGFGPADVESVTMGMGNLIATLLPVITQVASGNQPDPAAISQQLMGGRNSMIVIRTTKDIDLAPLMESGLGTASSHDGKTYYVLQNPDPDAPPMALHAADARTFLVSSEIGIQAAISDGPGDSENDQFAFVSRSSHFVQAFSSPILAGISGSIPDPGPGAPPQVTAFVDAVKGNIFGGAIVLDSGKDMKLNISLNLTESSAAADANKALKEGLMMAKQMAPLALGQAPPELQPTLTQAINSLSSSDSENVVTATLTIPASLVTALMENPELLGPIAAARGAANSAKQLNNMKQIALAMHNYHDTYNHLPSSDGNGQPGDQKKNGLSWRVHILPFLEQAELYNQFHLDEPWDSDHNMTLIPLMPETYLVEGVDTPGETSVHVFTGPNTPFDPENPTSFRNITDGTSNTIMAVTAGPDTATAWTEPGGLSFDPEDPASALGFLDDFFEAAMMDGSARKIPAFIDPETLSALIGHNDGKIVGEF